MNQVMGYKENKVIENTMGEPGDGEQSGQGGEEYSCKDNTEFVYNVCITYSIIIPLFHFFFSKKVGMLRRTWPLRKRRTSRSS